MQTVHRATNLADAERARDVLVGCGIPAHIAEEAHWEYGELISTDELRVMVDNRALDRARRAIEDWKKKQARSTIQATLGS